MKGCPLWEDLICNLLDLLDVQFWIVDQKFIGQIKWNALIEYNTLCVNLISISGPSGPPRLVLFDVGRNNIYLRWDRFVITFL